MFPGQRSLQLNQSISDIEKSDRKSLINEYMYINNTLITVPQTINVLENYYDHFFAAAAVVRVVSTAIVWQAFESKNYIFRCS